LIRPIECRSRDENPVNQTLKEIFKNIVFKNIEHRHFHCFLLLVRNFCLLVPVAHTCNPSYSGGRDREDHVLKPAQANSW
jgi:hypothetical protein